MRRLEGLYHYLKTQISDTQLEVYLIEATQELAEESHLLTRTLAKVEELGQIRAALLFEIERRRDAKDKDTQEDPRTDRRGDGGGSEGDRRAGTGSSDQS